MMRGTFANVRLKNQLAPGTEGGATRYFGPSGERDALIFDAAEGMLQYKASEEARRPSSCSRARTTARARARDWAAKGTRSCSASSAVIAESFERIHRSNLIGFGVLPLIYADGESADSLGLTGEERYSIGSVDGEPASVTVKAENDDGKITEFRCEVRIDTPTEWDYYRHGGILHFVLRDLAARGRESEGGAGASAGS